MESQGTEKLSNTVRSYSWSPLSFESCRPDTVLILMKILQDRCLDWFTDEETVQRGKEITCSHKAGTSDPWYT